MSKIIPLFLSMVSYFFNRPYTTTQICSIYRSAMPRRYERASLEKVIL
jgi:hypothetical protein